MSPQNEERLHRLERERATVVALLMEQKRKVSGARFRERRFGERLATIRAKAKARPLVDEYNWLTSQIETLKATN